METNFPAKYSGTPLDGIPQEEAAANAHSGRPSSQNQHPADASLDNATPDVELGEVNLDNATPGIELGDERAHGGEVAIALPVTTDDKATGTGVGNRARARVRTRVCVRACRVLLRDVRERFGDERRRHNWREVTMV